MFDTCGGKVIYVQIFCAIEGSRLAVKIVWQENFSQHWIGFAKKDASNFITRDCIRWDDVEKGWNSPMSIQFP